ncbi:DotI/IcmL family type IV secretion protein [Legionella shakespearei]|uniref:IcmL-like protein n=1 Tax=Legionella shakespearei DSM 23087 TaxID=1122169 RepID=A0A0W0YHV1_9GAMM|nr:DotI/IcmL family type IV secretion protein [Legionella shakespearei]KTD56522.1 IcmL-like protein [Legionella shakespearei DSM 23087]
MKNTMLSGALFTLLCTQVQAEATQQTVESQTTAPATTNTPTVTPGQTPAVIQNTTDTQQNQTNQVNPAQQDQTVNQQPTQTPQTTPQGQTGTDVQNVQQVPVQQAAPVIDCDYKIPASVKTIDQSIVLTWSEKAITQAFDFDPATLDAQLMKLQACFTNEGWQGFNSALQKSGNLDAIKSQKLNVSSQLDGQAQITEAKDNQWKISLPLQVVYQNDKEKVTQLLNVNLTVGRKITGDLGITQMIATPRTTVQQSNDAAAGNAPSSVTNGTNNQAAPTTNGTVPQTTPATDTTTTNNPAPPSN